jgi:hypothetical protein
MNNRMNNRRKTLAVLLLAAMPLAVFSQQLDLSDHKEYWSIGVAAFEAKNMSPENLYLTRSFPLLLRERLEEIPKHFFSESEAQAYRRAILRKEQQRLAEAVRADRRTRDELFFTSQQEKVSLYEQRIEDSLAAIQELQEMNPESIPFPESRPLRFVSGPDRQLIFDKPLLSPLQLAAQQNLDALLWGSFEEIQGFLYFEVRVFDAVLAEQVFSYSDATTPVELYDLSGQLIGQLASVLWGRDWSSLKVETVPPQAEVWVDGTFRGRSPVEIPYLLPGPRELRVRAPGHRTVRRTVRLEPYSRHEQSIALTREAGDSFSLSSDPEGAAVYEGSKWIGETPLELEKPDDLRRFLLRKEGYLDFPVYAGSEVEQKSAADLISEEVDPAAMQNRRRDELYRAFGAFALSLPVPLFLWGYGYDFRVLAAQAGSPSDAEQTADRLSYLSLGTMAVSAGFFVNLMVRLVRYIRAADRRA